MDFVQIRKGTMSVMYAPQGISDKDSGTVGRGCQFLEIDARIFNNNNTKTNEVIFITKSVKSLETVKMVILGKDSVNESCSLPVRIIFLLIK